MKKHIYYYRDKTKLCIKNFLTLKNLNSMKKNFKLKNSIRQKVILKSFKVNKNFNLSKLKKYCIYTGKLRFIIKNQKASIISFRELASKGKISGVFKK